MGGAVVFLYIQNVFRNAFCECPKVSVIIPVYNMESKISICINSILNQTLKEMEIICVDDGSKDRSLQFLNDFAKKDKRIVLFHQENCGPACARNRGIFLANGEYLGFVDSDDWVESVLFETVYETAKRNDVDVVEFDVFRRKGEFSKKLILRGMEAARNFIPGQCSPVVWSRIYSKTLIKGNGLVFDTTVAFGMEDIIFNLDLIPFVKSVALLHTMFYHRIPLESGLSRNYQAKNYKSVADVGLSHLKRIKQCQECLTKEDLKRIELKFRMFNKIAKEDQKNKSREKKKNERKKRTGSKKT